MKHLNTLNALLAGAIIGETMVKTGGQRPSAKGKIMPNKKWADRKKKLKQQKKSRKINRNK